MGKLIEADKIEAELRRLVGVWRQNADAAWVLGLMADRIVEGEYDAPAELQPKPPRQTLVEALADAPVGTRYRYRGATMPGYVLLVAPGKTYYEDAGHGEELGTVYNEYEDGGIRYADEYIVEYPTY